MEDPVDPTTEAVPQAVPGGVFAPLAVQSFRRIWLSSLVSNTGFLIQGVGSAWAMAEMSTPDMVAMVQTAIFLPQALLAVAAGALADMYDRRRVQIAALSICLAGTSAMTASSAAGLLSPWLLLGLCFTIGCGVALFTPAWQSSASEHVGGRLLPQAVALNGVSYNIARSIGPAVGGVIVAAAGAVAAFAINALCYIPLLLALLGWKRSVEPSRLPPERLGTAILSGIRYIMHMQPVMTAVIRALGFGFLGSAVISLLPLVARDVLRGDASTFGMLLGAFGMGAVAGVFVLPHSRRHPNERVVRSASVVLAAGVCVLALSERLPLSCIALFVAGLAWMLTLTTVNIALQLFVPRWVTGRAVAALHANTAAGIALGAWCWGQMVNRQGIGEALLAAAALLLLSPLLGLLLPLADRDSSTEEAQMDLKDPDVRLGINGRSGPIVLDVSYRIATQRARDFYNLMQEVRRIRQRNGAYDWTLSRDLGDPELWTERFRCPTWNDYLRLRSRATREERAMQLAAMEMHIGLAPVEVRRMLERPLGSVRWQAASPDPGQGAISGGGTIVDPAPQLEPLQPDSGQR